jgi:glyoxylase-like metal-dependent hydrolase (beta-lactamase superfamily II)
MSTSPDTVVSPETGITVIDLEFLGTPGVISAFLLDAGDTSILIETGPTTSVPALERGLKRAGRSFEDIGHIIVTHIHLDHSGAAGVILREYPQIQVHVHPAGTPHLIDPERLVRSAARIYGDDMDRLWGEIVGMPEERVSTLDDDATITLGNRSLRIAYTSGHASHHVVILDEMTGTLFTGDVGGVRVPGTSYVAVPIPPPEVDPPAWNISVERMRSLKPARIAPTHFGVHDDVDAHFAQILPRLAELVAIGENAGDDLTDTEEMTRRITAYQRESLGSEASPEVLGQLNLANPDLLGALGLQRYLRKRPT